MRSVQPTSLQAVVIYVNKPYFLIWRYVKSNLSVYSGTQYYRDTIPYSMHFLLVCPSSKSLFFAEGYKL